MTARCDSCKARGLKKCGCYRRRSPKVKAHLARIAKQGAQKSAYARRVKSWQRWMQMVKGMSVREAWRFVYLQGYNAGLARRARREAGRGA
jgi:hypothetical protein